MPIRIRSLICLILLAAAGPVRAEPNLLQLTIESRENNSELISFEASSPITPRKSFVLNGPDRVVIDLPHVTAAALKLPADYIGRLVRGVRFAQFDPQTSRLVLDLNYPVQIKSVSQGAPLVIELAPLKPLPEPGSAAAAHEQSVDPKAAQKQKPLIMIDAGHGGQDPGALGLHRTFERDVTLNFARALKKQLEASGRYRAALTRDTDTFIMLHERVNIARRAKADILISFHADSNPRPEARGLSLYTVSATASDAEAAALAERENKADIITGIDLNTTDADVAEILIDLTQRETMNKSTMLADSIVASLNPKINRLAKTHRYAGFRVLKAPDVPSVLIELGFLSNETDERLLLTADYRDLVVNSVIKGLDKFYAD